MSSLHLQLPPSMLEALEQLAARENTSVDQLATSALSEKIAALMSTEYLADRAARGSKEKYLSVLRKSPSVPPASEDDISASGNA